ncbi:MAG: AAA family ATPase [Acidobacteria bacterium]|nr:AAA family ATPase [Acidobacteriota bacterium]
MMTPVIELKQIPYGESDFDDFKVKNLYYVDKTRFIRHIEKKGSYLFLIRPRRFGKSLFLAILEAYYDIDYKDRFDEFFSGTDIHLNPTHEKNSYMVLKLNFSAVKPDVSKIEESFNYYIIKTTLRFLKKYEKFLDIDIKKVEEEITSLKSASDVMVAFLDYCKGKEQKIIDEYDNFANTILSESGEKAFIGITHGTGFLRAFFNVVKDGTTGMNAPISRLFMTGVSPVTMDDVTSGFNIGTNISLHSDVNEIMGFTKEEVETMIEYYRQSGKIRHSTPNKTCLIPFMFYISWQNIWLIPRYLITLSTAMPCSIIKSCVILLLSIRKALQWSMGIFPNSGKSWKPVRLSRIFNPVSRPKN